MVFICCFKWVSKLQKNEQCNALFHPTSGKVIFFSYQFDYINMLYLLFINFRYCSYPPPENKEIEILSVSKHIDKMLS